MLIIINDWVSVFKTHLEIIFSISIINTTPLCTGCPWRETWKILRFSIWVSHASAFYLSFYVFSLSVQAFQVSIIAFSHKPHFPQNRNFPSPPTVPSQIQVILFQCSINLIIIHKSIDICTHILRLITQHTLTKKLWGSPLGNILYIFIQ